MALGRLFGPQNYMCVYFSLLFYFVKYLIKNISYLYIKKIIIYFKIAKQLIDNNSFI